MNKCKCLLIKAKCNASICTHTQTHTHIHIYIFHNRQEEHVRAKKGYGGLALIFKNSMYNMYNIEILDKIKDGIIVTKLTDKCSDYTILLIAVICHLNSLHEEEML